MKQFVVCLILGTLLFSTGETAAQGTFKVDTSLTPGQLIRCVWLDSTRSNGLAFTHINHTGAKSSLGHFAYSGLAGDLPETGIILSTGDVTKAMGPNMTNSSVIHYNPGDSLVETIATGKTYDASTLSFRFNSFTDSIAFAFVFASDEYLEYVNEGVSDVFGFFCRKKGSSAWQNLATLPNSEVPITVDLINTKENSDYYLHNYYYNDVSARRRHHTAEEIERSWLLGFDGLTQGISTGMRVEPYSTYEFRITIADVGDNRFDSWVMLVGQSFKSSGKIVTPGLKELKSFLSIVDQDLAYTQSGDTLNVTSQLYFDFDSHTLQEASKSLLESLTKVMQFSHFELTILGYTDPSGSRDYNLQLSEKRAGSVAGFLEEAGISPNRLKAVGMGEYTLETDDAAARKVVFQLVPGK